MTANRTEVTYLGEKLITLGVLCGVLLVTTGCGRARKDVPEKIIDVDAGGHRLHMLIVGDTGPTVVLESGGGGGIGWEQVRQEVGRYARVVTYDRAGVGASEPGPQPRTGRQIAVELHTALGNADLSPPYILVGHSMGGPYVRIFAATYPDEVAGLVLVDPTQINAYKSMEEIQSWFYEHCRQDWDTVNAYCHRTSEALSSLVWMRGLEVKRMAEFLETVAEPKRSALRREWLSQLLAQSSRPQSESISPGIRKEFAALTEVFQQAIAATPLPNVPIILLSADWSIPPLRDVRHILDPEIRALEQVEKRWHLENYQQWADANPGVELSVARKCGHNIQLQNPQLVIATIREVIERSFHQHKSARKEVTPD